MAKSLEHDTSAEIALVTNELSNRAAVEMVMRDLEGACDTLSAEDLAYALGTWETVGTVGTVLLYVGVRGGVLAPSHR